MNIEREELKKAYARLIAKEIQEELEPKDIMELNSAKECIRNKLLEYDMNIKLNIYKQRKEDSND